MRKQNIFLGIILLTIYISSCKDDSNNITNPFTQIPTDSVIVQYSPIDTEINIALSEEINPTNRMIKLFLFTEKNYSIGGSKIICDLERINEKIAIDIIEIEVSSGGAAIPVPASATFDLNILSEDFYYLDISINSKNILGSINVTAEYYEMNIQPNNIIHITKEKVSTPRLTISSGPARRL